MTEKSNNDNLINAPGAAGGELRRDTYPGFYAESEKLCRVCGARNPLDSNFCVQCGSSFDQHGATNFGETLFDGWHKGRMLGSGCIGKVQEIEKMEDGRLCKSALRIIQVPDVTALREIKQWADQLKRFNDHRNFVKIYEYMDTPHRGDEGFDFMMRMELLTPVSNRELPRRMRVSDVIRLGTDICSALAACHKHNIVHGDLKIRDIFIDDGGNFKLGNIDLLRVMSEISGDDFYVKTQYSAPEVFSGKPYDRTADIYLLGIEMYTLLNNLNRPFMPIASGRMPLLDSMEADAMRLRGEVLPPPANASEELSRIILKACAFRPEDRYQSAEKFRDDLLKAASDEPDRAIYIEPVINIVYASPERMGINSDASSYMNTIYDAPSYMNTIYDAPGFMGTGNVPEPPDADAHGSARSDADGNGSPRRSFMDALSGFAGKFRKK